MARKKDANKWRHSEAKKSLHADIVAGVIPASQSEMSADEVCKHCSANPDFLLSDFHDKRLFADRLKRLRDKIKGKDDRRKRDADALAGDRLIFPKRDFNYRGEAEWQNSKAQELLKKDIDTGRHLSQTKEKLWLSKREHQEYDLNIFRGFVHQELKT